MPLKNLPSRSDEWRATPSTCITLWFQYENLMETPAWQDFIGRIVLLRDHIAQEILVGNVDKYGNDATQALRACYGMIENILAIPMSVERLKEISEEEMQALGTGSPFLRGLDIKEN